MLNYRENSEKILRDAFSQPYLREENIINLDNRELQLKQTTISESEDKEVLAKRRKYKRSRHYRMRFLGKIHNAKRYFCVKCNIYYNNRKRFLRHKRISHSSPKHDKVLTLSLSNFFIGIRGNQGSQINIDLMSVLQLGTKELEAFKTSNGDSILKPQEISMLSNLLMDYEKKGTCKKPLKNLGNEMSPKKKKRVFHVNSDNKFQYLKAKVSDDLGPTCDDIFCKFFYHAMERTNSLYLKFILKALVVLRSFLNEYKNIQLQYFNENFPNKFSLEKSNFTEYFDAESVPEMCNEFITEYLPSKELFGVTLKEKSLYLGTETLQLTELLQYFCMWLYENGYTQTEISLVR